MFPKCACALGIPTGNYLPFLQQNTSICYDFGMFLNSDRPLVGVSMGDERTPSKNSFGDTRVLPQMHLSCVGFV